jgi:SHS2 domain-containing protein
VYRWAEHVGELELQVEAASEPAVFAEAFAAFCELERNGGSDAGEERTIDLEAAQRADLLAEWLDELVYLTDAQRFVPENLVELRIDGGRLHAVVRGRRGEPSALVKAVTRHGLAFERRETGWRARVVLDV